MYLLTNLVRPVPFHLVSHSPRIVKSYLCISLHTCADLPVSYRVWMFQVPILVLRLVVRRVVRSLASRRLLPARVMGSTRGDSSSTMQFSVLVVAFSVTWLFLEYWVVSPIQTPTSKTRECYSSGLYPMTCLTWVSLLSIALRFIETRKPPNHSKVALPCEETTDH